MKLECHNNYTAALLPYADTVKFLALYTNGPVAIRGEVCGVGINGKKANKDARELGILHVGTRFPATQGRAYGTMGTGYSLPPCK